jgi:gamma-tubulin complex component 6
LFFRYLCLYDGEFSQHLCNSLFAESSASPATLPSPASLNRIVENAVMSSAAGASDSFSKNVGFVFMSDDDAVDSLRMGYQIHWPSNIVLSNSAIETYGDVFSFVLRIKRAVWNIEQIFKTLKALSK